MFGRSTDSGSTFSEPLLLADWTPGSSVSQAPVVDADDDMVYVLYTSGKDVFLIRSVDAGENFEDAINVSRSGIESPALVVTDHTMSISGNAVYVAWTVINYNWAEIYVARSTDRGASFSDPVNVSDTPDQGSSLPEVAAYGESVYLTWYESEQFYAVSHIAFARSQDGGVTFDRISNFSRNSPPYSSFEHDVQVGNDGAVYVVWRDEVPFGSNIKFGKSTDNGKTFTFKEVASGGWPEMDVEDDNVYITFGIQENGIDNIGFVNSLDGGDNFSTMVVLSNNTWPLSPYDQRPFPRISADGANVHVAWRYTSGQGGNHETYLATSYDEGRTFTLQFNISNSTMGDTGETPLVVASPVGRVFVMWEEHRLNATGVDLILVNGQIPEFYTEPFRQISFMTPVRPDDQNLAVVLVGGLAAAAGGAAYFFVKRKRKTAS
jgi:LPXTG-motif cell wall-anchored protein